MSIHWVFNKCDETVKTSLREYWAKKWPRLEKLLATFDSQLLDVRLTVTCHRQRPERIWFDIHGVINLPTGSLVANADNEDPRTALDRVCDSLVEEIKRHKEKVRKDYIFKRKRPSRADLSAAGPQSPEHRRRRKTFYDLFRPLLPRLCEHAQHRLKALELDGTLHRGELTVAELMDETLIQAWERFEERPRNVTLEKWFTDVIDDVLEQWIKQEPRPHRTLDEEIKDNVPAEAPQVDDQQWWSWLLGYDDTVAIEDIVPGVDGTEIWRDLEAREQTKQLWSLVNELPPTQRQAFVLYAIEDFAPFEIAMIQDRPEKDVTADIEAARRTLAFRLEAKDLATEFAPATVNAATMEQE